MAWQVLIPAIASALSAAVASRQGSGGSGRYTKQLMQHVPQYQGLGTSLERFAAQGLMNFNPEQAMRTSALAAFDAMRGQLGEDMERLRGHQMGRGRLDTGFGFEDEDRLVREGLRDLNQRIAQQAMGAQSMYLNALQSAAGLGGELTGRGLDLLASERDRRLRQAAEKRAMWGNIAAAFAPSIGAGLGRK